MIIQSWVFYIGKLGLCLFLLFSIILIFLDIENKPVYLLSLLNFYISILGIFAHPPKLSISEIIHFLLIGKNCFH
ncbi:MAG: hypothetical protein QG588_488 [Candidatus Poribacteria bacterium]|nr:hypothetical protein [Candidatus Poribacteria bacterium]